VSSRCEHGQIGNCVWCAMEQMPKSGREYPVRFCPQGHPLKGANQRLHEWPDGRIDRICRTCFKPREKP